MDDGRCVCVSLRLGVIPGFGGTQRLPRLVGLQKALTMMLQSKPIKAEEGHKLGLVDAIAPPGEPLMAAAMKLATDIAEKRVPRSMAFYKTDKLPDSPDATKKILGVARKGAKKVKSVMPHPSLCLDAVEAGVVQVERVLTGVAF